MFLALNEAERREHVNLIWLPGIKRKMSVAQPLNFVGKRNHVMTAKVLGIDLTTPSIL